MSRKLFATSIFIFLSMASFASQAQSKCPLPEGIRASLQMTHETINARLDGQTKELLERNIPPVKSRLPWAAVLMQSILDEVYSTQDPLDPSVHAAYRMEICFLMDQYPDSEISPDFERAYPLLRGCESVNEDLKIRCSMGVVHNITGIYPN